jgi:hypothetical protein
VEGSITDGKGGVGNGLTWRRRCLGLDLMVPLFSEVFQGKSQLIQLFGDGIFLLDAIIPLAA